MLLIQLERDFVEVLACIRPLSPSTHQVTPPHFPHYEALMERGGCSDARRKETKASEQDPSQPLHRGLAGTRVRSNDRPVDSSCTEPPIKSAGSNHSNSTDPTPDIPQGLML